MLPGALRGIVKKIINKYKNNNNNNNRNNNNNNNNDKRLHAILLIRIPE